MSDPIKDAQDYLHYADKYPVEPDLHFCEVCGEKFFKGSQFEEEKFCEGCLNGLKHIDFYEGLGLTHRYIYDNVLPKEKILNG